MESATSGQAASGGSSGADEASSPAIGWTPRHDQHSFYELLVSRLGDAVLVADDDGRYLDANPAAEMLLGHTRDELTRMWVGDLVVAADPMIETMWSQFLGAGEDTGRVRVRHADGHEVLCDYHATADITPGLHVSILRDVTAMVALEEAERSADLRLRSVLDSLGLLALVVRVDGEVEFVNAATIDTFQLDEDPTSESLPDPLCTPGILTALSDARAGAVEPPHWTEQVRLPGVGTRTIAWTGAFVRDRTDGVQPLVLIGEDITDRLDTDVSERRAERLQGITRLAGGVAHDFNNLLTVVTGHLALLEDLPDLPDAARDHLHQIADAAGRAASLAGQLLALGRRQALRPTVTPIAEVLDQSIGMLSAVLDGRPAVELELGAPDALVRIDATRFARVVVDLAIHLRDASADLDRIVIALDRVELVAEQARPLGIPIGTTVRLSVAGDGPEIAPELLEHVFEPFVAGEPSAVGRGLGLASVHGIVHQSGGSITVTSSPERGTRFEIHLPEIDRRHHAAPRSAQHPAAPGRDTGGHRAPNRTLDGRSTGTILLVDDDPAVRRVIEQILLRAGWIVDAHGEGHRALHALSNRRHDAMITDLVMPSMDGRELVRRARAVRPELPVLLVTGRAADLLDEGDGTGTPLDVEVLHKPFTASQLIRHVRNLLTSGPA